MKKICTSKLTSTEVPVSSDGKIKRVSLSWGVRESGSQSKGVRESKSGSQRVRESSELP